VLVHDLVRHPARRAPDTPALIDGRTRCTFAELDARTAGLAVGLLGLAEPGDRVAMVADNCAAWVECYYAVPRAGMVLTFLNQRLAPPELAAIVEAAGARVLIAQARYLDALRPLLATGRMGTVRVTVGVEPDPAADVAYERLVASGDPTRHLPAVGTDDVAWLIYTSGTTGTPKGAMLTHANVVAGVLSGAFGRPVAAGDVYLMPFPLCHVAGHNVLIQHLMARPVVVAPRFEPASFVASVTAHGVTTVSLAPTMISMLLDHLDAHPGDRGRLAGLRAIGYGASAIPVGTLRRGMDVLHAAFSQGYGMTELAGNAVFLGPEAHRRAVAGEEHLLAACGVPGPLVEVRVVDDGCDDVAGGSVGEIVVRGDQVTPGYWEDPAATAAAFTDGWFRTGDLGRWDAEGNLYVVDRAKDLIVTGGENVASREVEDAISTLPAVGEVAVVGVPDARWGEAVCAVVSVRPGATLGADEVVAAVRDRLAGFKKPRHVVFVDHLPKNATGKVVKADLRRLAAEHLGGRGPRE